LLDLTQLNFVVSTGGARRSPVTLVTASRQHQKLTLAQFNFNPPTAGESLAWPSRPTFDAYSFLPEYWDDSDDDTTEESGSEFDTSSDSESESNEKTQRRLLNIAKRLLQWDDDGSSDSSSSIVESDYIEDVEVGDNPIAEEDENAFEDDLDDFFKLRRKRFIRYIREAIDWCQDDLVTYATDLEHDETIRDDPEFQGYVNAERVIEVFYAELRNEINSCVRLFDHDLRPDLLRETSLITETAEARTLDRIRRARLRREDAKRIGFPVRVSQLPVPQPAPPDSNNDQNATSGQADLTLVNTIHAVEQVKGTYFTELIVSVD
jgi:hypothetical protein